MEINKEAVNANQLFIKRQIEDLLDNLLLMSPTECANGAGLDPSGFAKMLKGQMKITLNTLKKIANSYDVRLEWLINGEEPILRDKTEERYAIEEEVRPRLPMKVVAGALTGFAESAAAKDCEMIPVIKMFPSYDFIMTITGDSMMPRFESGDEIAISRVTDIVEWGKVYVLDTEEGAIIKRIYDEGDKIRCVSYNKEYPDFLIAKESVLSVYRIVGQLRF